MEISLLLGGKIASMLLMCLGGYILVKTKLLKAEDSRVLTVFMIYLAYPLAGLYSLQVPCTDDRMKALVLSAAFSIIFHLVMIIMSRGIGDLFHLNPVERTAMTYSNSGNLVIPIILSIFGSEYLFYNTAYGMIQTILFWTHCLMLMTGGKKMDFRSIFVNPNIPFLVIGFILFVCNIKLPTVIFDVCESFTVLLGPVAMVISGMLIGQVNFLKYSKSIKTWVVCFVRLLLYPIVGILLIRVSGICNMLDDGKTIMIVTLLAAAASIGNTIAQQAQLYRSHEEATYAAGITMISMLLCIITMPIVIFLAQVLL